MAHKTRTSDTELMPNGPLPLTLPELAAHLRIDRATVYRLLQRRELPIPILRLGRSPREAVAATGSELPLLEPPASAATALIPLRSSELQAINKFGRALREARPMTRRGRGTRTTF